jgi:hypothetical protein
MIASYDAIEPEKSDFVSAGFNTDNYVKVGNTCYYCCYCLLVYAMNESPACFRHSIHSSSDESEHEADDYDDDEEEDDRQERNLPYDTLMYFDNDFLCHNMPITLLHSLILCR